MDGTVISHFEKNPKSLIIHYYFVFTKEGNEALKFLDLSTICLVGLTSNNVKQRDIQQNEMHVDCYAHVLRFTKQKRKYKF